MFFTGRNTCEDRLKSWGSFYNVYVQVIAETA